MSSAMLNTIGHVVINAAVEMQQLTDHVLQRNFEEKNMNAEELHHNLRTISGKIDSMISSLRANFAFSQLSSNGDIHQTFEMKAVKFFALFDRVLQFSHGTTAATEARIDWDHPRRERVLLSTAFDPRVVQIHIETLLRGGRGQFLQESSPLGFIRVEPVVSDHAAAVQVHITFDVSGSDERSSNNAGRVLLPSFSGIKTTFEENGETRRKATVSFRARVLEEDSISDMTSQTPTLESSASPLRIRDGPGGGGSGGGDDSETKQHTRSALGSNSSSFHSSASDARELASDRFNFAGYSGVSPISPPAPPSSRGKETAERDIEEKKTNPLMVLDSRRIIESAPPPPPPACTSTSTPDFVLPLPVRQIIGPPMMRRRPQLSILTEVEVQTEARYALGHHLHAFERSEIVPTPHISGGHGHDHARVPAPTITSLSRTALPLGATKVRGGGAGDSQDGASTVASGSRVPESTLSDAPQRLPPLPQRITVRAVTTSATGTPLPPPPPPLSKIISGSGSVGDFRTSSSAALSRDFILAQHPVRVRMNMSRGGGEGGKLAIGGHPPGMMPLAHSVRETATHASVTVMVVDDNLTCIRMMTHALMPVPEVQVKTASDGVEAVRTACKSFPDIIFMDICMPQLNGIESASRIHTIYKLCNQVTPKIYIISANLADVNRINSSRETYGFITQAFMKPIEAEVLRSLVHEHITALGNTPR